MKRTQITKSIAFGLFKHYEVPSLRLEIDHDTSEYDKTHFWFKGISKPDFCVADLTKDESHFYARITDRIYAGSINAGRFTISTCPKKSDQFNRNKARYERWIKEYAEGADSG